MGKMGSNKSLQDWGAAGVGTDDSNTGKWADSLIGDLVFPDKKPKEIIEGDDDPKDKDTNNEDVKGWFDGHPEIGKMQKNVFDDIFDTTDEDTDETREEEEVPLIPAPTGFQVMYLEILKLYKLYSSTYVLNFGKSAILK